MKIQIKITLALKNIRIVFHSFYFTYLSRGTHDEVLFLFSWINNLWFKSIFYFISSSSLSYYFETIFKI